MFVKLKKIDFMIVGLLLIFLVISTLLVYSATVDSPNISIDLKKLLLIYVMGIIAFFVTTLIDYRALIKIIPYLYGVGIILLVAVLFFGVKLGGARGWFRLPLGFDFQPVELVKLILIMTLAAFMARRKGENLEFIRDVIPIGTLMLIPFSLVVIQPDLGNAVIFIVILIAMFWIGNIKYWHAIVGLAVAGGGIYLASTLYQSFHDQISQFLIAKMGTDHWMDRIDTFLDPSKVDKNASYQVDNAITAIGSGSLFGSGYLQGEAIHRNLVPVAYTDSIFAVVGEEFGFVGCSVLLLLYFLFIYRMILISIGATDLRGSYIIIGIVAMLVFQVFENVGMMIGIMPLTGITLPFISYGGSSLLINMVSIGLVMSIKVHQDPEPEF